MRRQLTPQERLLVALGALVIVLLLGLAVISGQIGAQTNEARRTRDTAKKNHAEAVRLVENYNHAGRLIEEHKERIKSKVADTDLATLVTKIEDAMQPRFQPNKVDRPTIEQLANGKYTLTRIKYTYTDKTMSAIVSYLYQIEDPQNGIIISNVLLQTPRDDEGETFQMVITLSVVTEAGTK